MQSGGLAETFEIVYANRRRRLRRYALGAGVGGFLLALLVLRGAFNVYPSTAQFDLTRAANACALTVCAAPATAESTFSATSGRAFAKVKAHLCAAHAKVASGKGRWPGHDDDYSSATILWLMVAAFGGVSAAAATFKILGAMPTFATLPAGSFERPPG